MPPITATESWRTTLSLARTYVEDESPSISFELRPPELGIIADSVRFLRANNYKIDIVNGDADTTLCERMLATDIDALVHRYGGLNLTEWLFDSLRKFYDQEFERYLIVPRTTNLPDGRESPMMPFGYLLNLAAKHLSTPGDGDPAVLDRIVRLSRAFAVTYDVQPYYSMHGHFNDRTSILKHLRETAAFDSIFCFPQANRRNVGKRVLGILEPLERRGYIDADFNMSLADLALLLQTAFNLAPSGPSAISSFEVAQQTSLPQEKVANVLNLLARDRFNSEFLAPLDMRETNLDSVPFVRCGENYLLLDPAVAANATLESILSVCRKAPGREVDKIVGLEGVENYVRQQLVDRNCTSAYGLYKSPTEGEAECDCVIETESKIIIIEAKKKALTNRARSTDPIALLADLSRSLLHGHCQTGRHELALHQDGCLPLSKTVARENRTTERVALSLHHFGTFHSRDLAMDTLTLMTGSEFTSDTTELRELRELNRQCSRLQTLFEKATGLGLPEPGGYFNCWFVSLDIFDALLADTNDPSSFWEALKSTRHISAGTRNWFAEYRWVQDMHRKANLAKNHP